MDANLVINQKKLGTRRRFEFGPEKLNYTIADFSGVRQFSIGYEAIDVLNPASLTVKSPALVRRLLRVALFGFVASFFVAAENNLIATILGLSSTAFFLIVLLGRVFGLFAITFEIYSMSSIPAGAQNNQITVISGDGGDTIANELVQRWRGRLRTLYAVADLSADPNQQRARLQWLKDRDVISSAEFQEQIKRLTAISGQSVDRANEALN